MRRLGQVGDHRLAADVLAEADGQRAGHVVVRLAGNDFRELDHLPPGIGQFERHARLAGHGFDDADRDHGQRPRQVARQIDDLGTLDADRRLDFVTGNDRPRHRRQNLDLHTEVGELALDQARRVFQRFGADRLGRRRCRVEQMQRRQLPADDDLGEQRHLLLALDALLGLLRNRHLGRRRLDDDRIVQFDATFLDFDLLLALQSDFAPDTAVAPGIHQSVEKAGDRFEHAAQALERPQPRHPREDAPAGRHRRQQQQRRTGITEMLFEQAARLQPEHAARRQRQIDLERMETQRFERRTGDQQQDEAGQRNVQGTPVGVAKRRMEAPESPPDDHGQQNDPPPRREAEQVEHQVSDPGAELAGRVEQLSGNDGVRPARIVLVVTPQRHRQEQRDRAQCQPARLLQKLADLFR